MVEMSSVHTGRFVLYMISLPLLPYPFISGREEGVWHFLASGVVAGSLVLSAEGRRADRRSDAGSGVLPGVLVWWGHSRIS